MPGLKEILRGSTSPEPTLSLRLSRMECSQKEEQEDLRQAHLLPLRDLRHPASATRHIEEEMAAPHHQEETFLLPTLGQAAEAPDPQETEETQAL